MQQKVLGRVLIIVAVTVIALYYIYPSARLIQYRLTVAKPDSQKLHELETRSLPGGANPVRFGLDLQGGTDVTLALDERSTLRERLEGLRRDIRGKVQRERLQVNIAIDENRHALVFNSDNPAEHGRELAAILTDYSALFEPFQPEAFEKSKAVTLILRDSEISNMRRTAMDAARKVIARRVDALGLVQPVVVREGENRIRIQMPGVQDPKRVVDTIIKPAQLEFRILHKDSESEARKLFTPQEYDRICAYIKQYKKLPQDMKFNTGATVPFGYIMVPGESTKPSKGGAPSQVDYMPFLVSEELSLTGSALRNASVFMNSARLSGSPWEISLQFDRQGAVDFASVTRANVGKQLAIVLDGFLYSAPVIKQAITGGNAVIEGTFSQSEAVDLSLVLKAGALPANFQVLQQQVVEATLGTDSIKKGILSLLVGSLAVIVFLIIYYGTSGVIATVALLVNVLCVAAVVVMSRATLTLSGIAGVLLTVGMADDANVLINERIREEKATSRGLKTAVSKGFSRAFSVIFDSNLTTLITALVLLQFGVGSVQGFALTLTFGIFATLFTGLFVTHTLTDLWIQWRNQLNIGQLTIFKNPKFDFIKFRYFGYAFSGTLMLAGFIAIFAQGGLRFGVEFTGGVLADVSFAKPTSTGEIKTAIESVGLPSPIVQKVRGENRYLIRVKAENNNVQQTEAGTRKALADRYGAGATVEGSRSVSNEVGNEFVRRAIIAVLLSCIGILIYMAFRFELVFGAGAVIALFHDVLITVGLLTIFNQEITLDVVAALLTVIGYSVNDTIVIFDRVRETLRTTYGLKYKDLLNQSINMSLNRTTITVLTTLFTTIIMLIFGGPGLRGFALALTIGIIKGTYSSSFVAAPLLFEYHEYRRRQAGEPTVAK